MTVISAIMGYFFIPLITVSTWGVSLPTYLPSCLDQEPVLPAAGPLSGESRCESGCVATVRAAAVSEHLRLPLSLSSGKDEFGKKVNVDK